MLSELFIAVAIGVVFLTYANGANDNFKGVATLYGSGVLSYRTALIGATAATWLGSIAAIFVADQLVRAFSGKGLVDPAVLSMGTFPVAVAGGAALTVLVATRLGLTDFDDPCLDRCPRGWRSLGRFNRRGTPGHSLRPSSGSQSLAGYESSRRLVHHRSLSVATLAVGG